LTQELIGKILSGMIYLNVHTAGNPNGEIRGQLKLETDRGFKAMLNAAQEVHTSTSTAIGLGAITVSLTAQKLEVKLITTGLTGAIIGAHFHNAAAGVNGGVVYNLTSYFSTSATESGAFGYWTDTDVTAMFMIGNEVITP
jgi:hypothetical protein